MGALRGVGVLGFVSPSPDRLTRVLQWTRVGPPAAPVPLPSNQPLPRRESRSRRRLSRRDESRRPSRRDESRLPLLSSSGLLRAARSTMDVRFSVLRFSAVLRISVLCFSAVLRFSMSRFSVLLAAALFSIVPTFSALRFSVTRFSETRLSFSTPRTGRLLPSDSIPKLRGSAALVAPAALTTRSAPFLTFLTRASAAVQNENVRNILPELVASPSSGSPSLPAHGLVISACLDVRSLKLALLHNRGRTGGAYTSAGIGATALAGGLGTGAGDDGLRRSIKTGARGRRVGGDEGTRRAASRGKSNLRNGGDAGRGGTGVRGVYFRRATAAAV